MQTLIMFLCLRILAHNQCLNLYDPCLNLRKSRVCIVIVIMWSLLSENRSSCVSLNDLCVVNISAMVNSLVVNYKLNVFLHPISKTFTVSVMRIIILLYFCRSKKIVSAIIEFFRKVLNSLQR